MTHRITGILIASLLGLHPCLKAQAQDYYDYNHHEHHVSTTEKVLAGALVAGLAVAAAKAADHHSDHHETMRNETSSHENTRVVYIHDSRGTVPIYLRSVGNGGYVGPRGEYYERMPSQEHLERNYAVHNKPVPTPAPRPPQQVAPLQARSIQSGVLITRGGAAVATCHTAMMNVERYKFINSSRQIVVKSRGNHGPATVEMFDTNTGRLRDKVLAFAIRKSGVSWAYGFED